MHYVVLLLTVGVTIYALVDCWNRADDEVCGLSRLGWLTVMLLFPLLGSTAYLLYGRGSLSPLSSLPGGRPRVIAPDDDPEFLHQLDIQRSRMDAEARHLKDKQERATRERQERAAGDKAPDRAEPEKPDGGGHSGRPTNS
jgi:hypothetical protein